eukprot:5385742-Ditylum_brightwellii.AAC.1
MHKPDCKKGEGTKREREEEIQNERENCLKVGQSQQILKTVSLLYHFAAILNELHRTDSQMAHIVTQRIAPQLQGMDLGMCILGM